MKIIILATLLFLSATAFAAKTKVAEKAEVTAEMAARASDAVDSALQVL
jgi:plasmid maintenance system antidote protein VapI